MAVTDDVPSNGTAAPRRLLLVSVPRTCSNLLSKILNIHNQPNLLTNQKGGYFFFPAFAHAAQLAKAPEDWSDADIEAVKGSFQTCTDALEEWSARARDENKVCFAKEHAWWFQNPAGGRDDLVEWSKSFRSKTEAYGPNQTFSPNNETILSDQYLRTWQMAFIIRHPALAWPSMYRALTKISAEKLMDEDAIKGASTANTSLRCSRKLYDWCMEQPDVPTPPPVIDAHDLIHTPNIVEKLCEQTGLDKSVLQFEWDQNEANKAKDSPFTDPNADAAKDEVTNRAVSIMLSSLQGSKGVMKDKAPENIDIAAEGSKVEG